MKKMKLLLSFLLIFLNLIGMFTVSFADNAETPSIAAGTPTPTDGQLIEVSKDNSQLMVELIEIYEETIPTPTSTPTPSSIVSVTPTAFKISGYIKPDFAFSESSPAGILSGFKVEIPEIGLWVITSQDGKFELTNIPLNNNGYQIVISKDNFLKRQIDGVVVTNDLQISTKDQPIEMWAGDILKNNVQDGAINMLDVMLVAQSFNTGKGNPNYNQNSDLNMDGIVNMTDILIVSMHFNKSSYLPAGDAYEPNDSFDTANSISGGTRLTATINDATDIDCYKVDVPSNVRFNLSLAVPSDKDFNVELYNSSRIKIASSTLGTGITENINITLTRGTYYIKVYGNSGAYSSDPYGLQVSLTSTLIPRGNLESPLGGIIVSGPMLVSGWFLDGLGVSKIEVLVDEMPVGETVCNITREDVYNTFPDYENHNAGYSYTLDTNTLSNGVHVIRVRETGSTGVQTTIGGSYVTVSNKTP